MKVAAGQVAYSAKHHLEQEEIHKERLNVWFGAPPGMTEGRENETPQLIASDRIMFSREFRKAFELTASVDRLTMPEDDTALDPRLQAMKAILEILMGREIRISEFSPAKGNAVAAPLLAGEDGGSLQGPAGWGLEYDSVKSYRESEELQIGARGHINTADGREIRFNLRLNMNREFYRSTELHLRLGDAMLIDPLVINFNGKGAELTEATFLFDLDADGEKEEVPGLARGSGFLALDKNGDGEINDGSELFGPETGHGFSELARFDLDGNGWIDENDPIWDKLAVWIRDQAGAVQLAGLRETGIGALHLEPVTGEFRLTTSNNNVLGLMREHAVFLGEDGRAGLIQEIDLKA